MQFWDQPKVDHKSELTSLTLASPIHHCVLDIQGREKRFANFAKLQAGPGRKAKQGQEEKSRNHVQTLFLGSVLPKRVNGQNSCGPNGNNL